MNNISLDTEMQKSYAELLINTLAYNAAIVEYASLIVSAGPVAKREQHRKYLKEFKRIHDEANAKHIDIMVQLEKRLRDDRD